MAIFSCSSWNDSDAWNDSDTQDDSDSDAQDDSDNWNDSHALNDSDVEMMGKIKQWEQWFSAQEIQDFDTF